MNDKTDPQALGLAIRRYARTHDCTVSSAADAIYRALAEGSRLSPVGVLEVACIVPQKPELQPGSQIASVRSNGGAPS